MAKVFFTTLNRLLLVALAGIYVRLYRDLPNKYTRSLLVLSLALLLYAFTSNPLVQVVFGFHPRPEIGVFGVPSRPLRRVRQRRPPVPEPDVTSALDRKAAFGPAPSGARRPWCGRSVSEVVQSWDTTAQLACDADRARSRKAARVGRFRVPYRDSAGTAKF
ncbi:hypothetical protein [Halorussus halobius]|uniref:hypothetical protein n=1 Tax=Halorussus halobius TaxID=1710537 RepID=UPI001FCF27D9|nr:hypothetical protein [Halorussus halobius]